MCEHNTGKFLISNTNQLLLFFLKSEMSRFIGNSLATSDSQSLFFAHIACGDYMSLLIHHHGTTLCTLIIFLWLAGYKTPSSTSYPFPCKHRFNAPSSCTISLYHHVQSIGVNIFDKPYTFYQHRDPSKLVSLALLLKHRSMLFPP